MAIAAESNQIFCEITAQRTSPLDVVNLELPWASATLTPPTIALEDLPAKISIGSRI
jgi:hypothetical protein